MSILQRAAAAMPAGVYPPLAVVDGDISNANLSNTSVSPANCHSGARYDTDGTKYSETTDGNYTQNEGSWLTSGSASDCWLEWSLASGSLDTAPSSTPPRIQMSAGAIDFGVLQVVTGTKLADVDISIYDAATGGNLLDSFQITLDAEEA